jgi:hypothetical protein
MEGLKTVADAAYIRRLSRNVGRGYEQKWRLFSDPGGRAPLGFALVGDRQLLEPIEGPGLNLVRRAFDLYPSAQPRVLMAGAIVERASCVTFQTDETAARNRDYEATSRRQSSR